jgi:hypothetical protein
MAEPLTEVGVKYFYDQLAFKLETAMIAQRKLDLHLASDLNVVRDYVNPGENRVSDILANLLNPEGSHGQEDRFLRLFLEAVRPKGINYEDGMKVKVRREDPTSLNRRMDILVELGEQTIAIENKIQAGDQDSQISHYCDELDRRGNYVLFYLTPTAKNPSSYSIDPSKFDFLQKDGKLRCISYREEIQRWLTSCIKECEAEKVRWFLKDLAEFVAEDIVTRNADDEVHN